MTDPALTLCADLVAIDSVNPSLVPGAAGEQAIASMLADRMRRIGLDVHVREVAPGRPNVVGVLEGRAPGRSLMFCGHIDTVGVAGMGAPFEPRIEGGRLYGRGAQDMKGGVAAMVDAARLVAERGLDRGRLIVAAVVDEEYESIGADALAAEWQADGAVVTEPTDLQVAIGHKGFAWLEIETLGRAAHGSRPLDGRDAILRMGRILQRLEALDRELQARPPHPLMGTGSLHASIIEGGRELSSYPDRCRLLMERRTIAGENGQTALDEVLAILRALGAADPELEARTVLRFSRPAYEVAPDHPLPRAVVAAATHAGCATATTGMSFWTDAAVLAAAGVPSVLFGPGGAGLHSIEEYVNVNDVLACRDALASLARNWC
jgi:acetylornithine deacetylase